jgi:hypothetical protein
MPDAQIPDGLERLTPVAEYQQVPGRGFVKVASMQPDPEGDFVGIRDLAFRLAEERKKLVDQAADAVKFAETQYEEVCAERDRLVTGLRWALEWIEKIAEVPIPHDEQDEWESYDAAKEALQHAQEQVGEDRG